MANAEQLALLKAGVEGWNEWREKEPYIEIDVKETDLRGANLNGANLSQADVTATDLSEADLREAQLWLTRFNVTSLREADLTGADVSGSYFRQVNLRGANLTRTNLRGAAFIETDLSALNFSGANLSEASLRGADLSGANLNGANLSGADLSAANLSGADLTGAILSNSNLVRANISNAKISKSNVYGVNVWDLEGEFQEQKDLIITPEQASPVTVDNIKVAQFIYLILNNKEIRDVINTLTSKTVLILGRFAIPERKAILDALRDKLREYDLLPMVFDFERPINKDFTETIKTLAGLCYFVIADVTNPKSSPLELQATVPDFQIPFVPIIQEGEQPFAMMVDLQKKYNWVLSTRTYSSKEALINKLKEGIIDPAMEKHNELKLIKARRPDTVSLG
jgi:uncharacterized protein YjbI with pentapeptide repeats